MKKTLLTTILRTVTNTNNRFRATETEDEVKRARLNIRSILRSGIRGGIIGGLVGYFFDCAQYGVSIGLIYDETQNFIRDIRLTSLYANSPEKYSRIKAKYRRWGLVD